MKQTILLYGFYTGGILLILFTTTWILFPKMSIKWIEIFGYVSILVSLIPIYFGIKKRRDTKLNGKITFGRAFIFGVCIAAIASVIIAITDTIYKTWINPGFYAEYSSKMLEEIKHSSKSLEIIEQEISKRDFEYKKVTPVFNFIWIFFTVFMIGICMSAIFSLRLRKNDTL